jgi:non-specific serine/threonine protein kinase
MELPAEGASDVQAVAQSEAVQLFVDRTRDVNDRFNLTSNNAPDVARVVRTLDGVPLALELAAARTRVLPVARLASRLTDVFKVLPRGHREARPHQQTLAAVWDWSWDLLTEVERRLCERLSVFRGGFSLEAAEEVAADEALPAEDVLDALAELVDKSMIVPRPGEQGRYGMLEMVRQYTSRRLHERGEEAAVRARHAAFFLELAERSVPTTFGGEHPDEMYGQLAGEDDNLRLAAEWLLAHGEPVDALAFTGAVGWYLFFRRMGAQGCAWLERALRAAPDAPPALRARALGIAGWMYAASSEQDKSLAYLDEAAELYTALGRPVDASFFLGMQSMVHFLRGDCDTAAAVLEDHRLIVPERTTVAHSYRNAAACLLHLSRGELAAARETSDTAVQYARDASTKVVALTSQLALFRLLARTEEASLQILELSRATRDPMGIAAGLQGLAMSRILEGDVRGALAATHRALDVLATLSRETLVYYMGWGRIGAPRPGDAEAAADLFEFLFKQPRVVASRRVLEVLLKASARAAAGAGEHEAAARLTEAAERLRGANGEA